MKKVITIKPPEENDHRIYIESFPVCTDFKYERYHDWQPETNKIIKITIEYLPRKHKMSKKCWCKPRVLKP